MSPSPVLVPHHPVPLQLPYSHPQLLLAFTGFSGNSSCPFRICGHNYYSLLVLPGQFSLFIYIDDILSYKHINTSVAPPLGADEREEACSVQSLSTENRAGTHTHTHPQVISIVETSFVVAVVNWFCFHSFLRL